MQKRRNANYLSVSLNIISIVRRMTNKQRIEEVYKELYDSVCVKYHFEGLNIVHYL